MDNFTENEEKIRTVVEKKLGDGYTVKLISANKNNMVFHGINICVGKSSISPTIYFTPAEDQMTEEAIDETTDKIVEVFKQNAGRMPGHGMIFLMSLR